MIQKTKLVIIFLLTLGITILNAADKISYASSYGIQGDGTDETSKVQDWLNSASSADKLVGINKTVKISKTLNLILKDNLTIDFANMKITGYIGSNTHYVKGVNTYANAGVTLTSNISAGDTTVNVSDSSKFSVGEYIWFESSALMNGQESDNYQRGEMAKITNISGNTLTLNNSFYYDNYASNITIKKMNTYKNITVKNLQIHTQSQDKNAIEIFSLENSLVSNFTLTAETYGYNGLLIQNGFGVEVTNNTIYDFDHNGQATGYGIVVTGHDINVHHNTVKRNRHDITTGSRLYLCRDIKFNYNNTGNSTSGSIDFHNNTIDGEIIGNSIDNTEQGYAINIRNQGRTVVANNNIKNSQGAGILIFNNNNHSVEDLIIKDNVIDGFSLSENRGAIYFSDAEIPLKNILIQGNTFKNSNQGYTIYFKTSVDSSIYENIVIDSNTAENVAGFIVQPTKTLISRNNVSFNSNVYFGILMSSWSAKDVYIQDNTFTTTNTKYGLMIKSGVNININNNLFFGYADSEKEITNYTSIGSTRYSKSYSEVVDTSNYKTSNSSGSSSSTDTSSSSTASNSTDTSSSTTTSTSSSSTDTSSSSTTSTSSSSTDTSSSSTTSTDTSSSSGTTSDFEFNAEVMLTDASETFFRKENLGTESILVEFSSYKDISEAGYYPNVYIPNDSNTPYIAISSKPLSKNVWYDLKITYTANSGAKIYLDGNDVTEYRYGIAGNVLVNNNVDYILGDNFNGKEVEKFNGKYNNVTLSSNVNDSNTTIFQLSEN